MNMLMFMLIVTSISFDAYRTLFILQEDIDLNQIQFHHFIIFTYLIKTL